jgi:hypothetical protein
MTERVEEKERVGLVAIILLHLQPLSGHGLGTDCGWRISNLLVGSKTVTVQQKYYLVLSS